VKKILILLSIVILMTYGNYELTRVIIEWGKNYGWIPAFTWEIIFMWVAWLLGVILIAWRVR